MAIGFTDRDTNLSQVAATSYATAAISPADKSLIVATIAAIRNAGLGADPTCSGLGASWTLLARDVGLSGTGNPTGIYMFIAQAASYSVPGAITFSFGSTTWSEAGWTVTEVTGSATDFDGGGLAVCRQSGHNSTVGGTSVNASLGALGAGSASYGSMFINSNTEAVNNGAGYTDISFWTAGLFGQQDCERKTAASTSVDWSWTNAQNATAVSVEIMPFLDVPNLGRPRRLQDANPVYRM